MALILKGGFRPGDGIQSVKVSRAIEPDFWNGITVLPLQTYTAQPGLLNLPSENNTWMNGITTTGVVGTYTAQPATLNLPSANNTWMNGITTTGVVGTYTAQPATLNLPSANNTWMNGITVI